MDWEAIFGVANTATLGAWAVLILLPRWPWALQALRFSVVAALSAVYAVLVAVYFFRVDGGGFGSLAAVAQLFSSEPVLLAGWIHYLAFDLFVGTWIAERADARQVSRVVQAPVLAATFMFGPLGYLLYTGLELLPAKEAAA